MGGHFHAYGEKKDLGLGLKPYKILSIYNDYRKVPIRQLQMRK